ncbi:MAG: TetR/AcrR family transcriptional regulator [Cohnella sp.]|uniref:TetR/AcrR family transcriptional regulator n=1 Tax=Cohnella sp. TaxID=1883426 RepID=UPI000E370A7F|nr:TetR/AcrR family transcriptional regulator [Cohnella sp.]REK62477.1 MAG: TetR/AcrR family transcriptional regulator [Cohnella sp.]
MNAFVDINGKPIANKNKIALLDIAIDTFSLNGFTAVSIRDITRKAGIKESSFYNHFRSKDELLETIFVNFRKSVQKIMPPLERVDDIVAAMDPKSFLLTGLRNFRDHVQSPKMEQIWRIIYLEQCRNPMAREMYVTEIVQGVTAFLEVVFRKYIERNQIRPYDPKTLAVEYQYPLFAMISEFILLRLDRRSTEEIERRMTDHAVFFSHVICRSEE